MSDDPEFFLTYTFDVKLIRIIGTSLVPTELSVTANIVRSEDFEDSDVELGLSKCKYWFDTVVSRAIAFGVENATAYHMLVDDEGDPRVSNIFMMIPDEPRDEVLATVFQSKMNALSAGAFEVEAIDIRSDNLNGICFTLAGNHDEFLPSTMEEWVGGPSHFDVPWWKRDDASTLDVLLDEDGDKSKPPSWCYDLSFLDKRNAPAEKETAKIIHHVFKPTVVKGGKDD